MILGKTWMSMFLSWYLWSFLTHIVDSSKQSISWDQLGAICAPSRLGPTEDGGCPTAKPVHRSSLHHPTFRSFGYLSRYLSSFITVSKHRNQAFYINSRIYIYTYIYIYIYIQIVYMFTDIILIRLKDDESVFELGQNLLREILVHSDTTSWRWNNAQKACWLPGAQFFRCDEMAREGGKYHGSNSRKNSHDFEHDKLDDS